MNSRVLFRLLTRCFRRLLNFLLHLFSRTRVFSTRSFSANLLILLRLLSKYLFFLYPLLAFQNPSSYCTFLFHERAVLFRILTRFPFAYIPSCLSMELVRLVYILSRHLSSQVFILDFFSYVPAPLDNSFRCFGNIHSRQRYINILIGTLEVVELLIGMRSRYRNLLSIHVNGVLPT